MAFTGVLIIVSMAPIFGEYKTMVSRLLAHEDLEYGPAYEIAAYLRRENSANGAVYLLNDHIAYWLIGAHPPTRLTTHPSNIADPYVLRAVEGEGASTEDELRKVFRKAPEFVVMTKDVGYLRGGPRALLDQILADEYVLVAQIQGRRIYRLKPGP